jgi:hypothetical protein
MTNAKIETGSLSHISTLLVKYWCNELSPAEEKILKKWVGLSPQNQAIYKELTSGDGMWQSIVLRYPTLKEKPAVRKLNVTKRFHLFKPKSKRSSSVSLLGALALAGK